MRIDWRAYRAIWPTATRRIDGLEAAAEAIKTMVARGAPLIGATAAFGLARAEAIRDEDVALNRRIGEAGLPLIESLRRELGRPVSIFTRCNAGWLATVDRGTSTTPAAISCSAVKSTS